MKTIVIAPEMSREARDRAVDAAWSSARHGVLRARLLPELSTEDLRGLWWGARNQAHEHALLQIIVGHPHADSAFLSDIATQVASSAVLRAIATSGRASPEVLDRIPVEQDESLAMAVALARFAIVLDGAPLDGIRAALAGFEDEPGAPAHYLAACHPRTPRTILEELLRSDEDHVVEAARSALEARAAEVTSNHPTDSVGAGRQ